MQHITPKPTEKELEILQVLWKQGPSNVREVNDIISAHNEIAYTTTLKLMQIMLEKGLVRRIKEGKLHIYEAVISEEKTQKQLVDKLLETAFKGSAMKLVMQVLGNGKSSSKELDEIRTYLDKLEKEK